MKSKDNKFKSFVATFILAIFLLITIASFAYAYFSANITLNQNLNVITNFSDEFTPVFTATSNGNLELYVSTADMLQSGAASGNTTVAAQANQSINVVFIGGGGSGNSSKTCTFDFVWTSSGTAYTASSGLGSLKEYTLKITDNTGATVLAEKQVSTMTSGSKIASSSITSSGTEVNKVLPSHSRALK